MNPAGAVRLTDEQRLDWLRLIRTDKVGPRTFRELVSRYGGAGAALEALPELALKRLGRGIAVFGRAEAEREMATARRRGARFVALGEVEYPRTLRVIADPPPLLCVRGNVAVLGRPAAAIVGSRNASVAGRRFAQMLAGGIGAAGFAVVSGLARGIDAAAHEGSLASGTIAVLAGGQDRVYPAEHEGLAETIVQRGGAVVSEMPMGWEARGRDFPRRNRIVSGLALGVVVVEAARRSGSLITARFALEQGREVLAVPGSPLDPRAEGTNDLIRQGATLVSGAEHVVAALAPLAGAEPQPPRMEEPGRGETPSLLYEELDLDGLPGASNCGGMQEEKAFGGDVDDPLPAGPQAAILALLSAAPVAIDDLARHAGLAVREVQQALLDLELAGRIERHGGNLVSLI